MADEFAAALEEAEGTVVKEFEFHGEKFALAESIGLMPLMKFAHAARSGMDTAEMDGLAAMYDLLQDCLADKPVVDETGMVLAHGWDRFQQVCIDKKLQGDDIFAAVKDLIAAVSANPTSAPSGSSDGQSSTTENSKGGSSTDGSFEARKRALGIVPVPDILSSAG